MASTDILSDESVPSPKQHRGGLIFVMKPTIQEIFGVLLIPLLYLLITFLIARSRGMEFDKKWAGFGWPSDASKRMKTWRVGAISMISFLLIAPFMYPGYGLLEEAISFLPVFLQPIATLFAGGICVYLIFVAIACICKCLIACDSQGE